MHPLIRAKKCSDISEDTFEVLYSRSVSRIARIWQNDVLPRSAAKSREITGYQNLVRRFAQSSRSEK